MSKRKKVFRLERFKKKAQPPPEEKNVVTTAPGSFAFKSTASTIFYSQEIINDMVSYGSTLKPVSSSFPVVKIQKAEPIAYSVLGSTKISDVTTPNWAMKWWADPVDVKIEFKSDKKPEEETDPRFERIPSEVAFSNRVFIRHTIDGKPTLDNNYGSIPTKPERKWSIVDSIFGANLVTSLVIDDPDERERATMTSPEEVLEYLAQKGKADDATHRPVLDFDVPIQVLPSSQLGHYHLYIDHDVEWKKYVAILDAFKEAGIVEVGYVEASKEKGFSSLRPPGVTKPDSPKGVEVLRENAILRTENYWARKELETAKARIAELEAKLDS